MRKVKLEEATARGMSQFFSEAQQGENKTDIATSSTKEPEEPKKAIKKSKKVFSFRADDSIVSQFRAYCSAKYGMSVDDIGEEAMREYMANHPLEDFEKKVYQEKISKS